MTFWPRAQTCFFAFAHFRAEYSASCAIPGTSAASRLYDDENNGLFSSPSSPGTKTLEKKQSRRTRNRGRREKEGRASIPRRKGPRRHGAVIFSSSGDVTGISLVIKSHRAVWLELMVKWSICPEGKKKLKHCKMAPTLDLYLMARSGSVWVSRHFGPRLFYYFMPFAFSVIYKKPRVRVDISYSGLLLIASGGCLHRRDPLSRSMFVRRYFVILLRADRGSLETVIKFTTHRNNNLTKDISTIIESHN